MDKVKDIKFKTTERFFGKVLDPFNDNEINKLLNDVQACGKSCAIMTVRYPYSKRYEPKENQLEAPAVVEDEYLRQLYLQSLFREELKTASLEDIVNIAKTIKIEYTIEQINIIEKLTKGQSKSIFWYRFRTGRITASIFKQVARTSTVNPSASLLKSICFPKFDCFKTKEMEYGTKFEPIARQEYCEMQKRKHNGFEIKEKGLCLNNHFPYIGASPDGYFSCDCHSDGVLEIKCPYRAKDQMSHYLDAKDSAVIKDENGRFVMDNKHAYYYQIQMQMFVLNCDHGDFMLWNSNECILIRVEKDDIFWNSEYPKVVKYFETILLPELLGCYYSKHFVKPPTGL